QRARVVELDPNQALPGPRVPPDEVGVEDLDERAAAAPRVDGEGPWLLGRVAPGRRGYAEQARFDLHSGVPLIREAPDAQIRLSAGRGCAADRVHDPEHRVDGGVELVASVARADHPLRS